jgi:protein-L-isoaspartate(D-aspartate) O-methyltransferase
MGDEIQDDPFFRVREAMVREQIEARGVLNERVLEAMRRVPRHPFVPRELWEQAYADYPLPIGVGPTISQPYIVAFMAEVLELEGSDRLLEVGSGSGYAVAVLAHLCAEAFGIELEPELHARSAALIHTLGYSNIQLRCGDGFHGWPEAAPFDAILLSCAAREIPRPLWEQLKPNGRFLYPRGPARGSQELVLVTKTPLGPKAVRRLPVRFVPLRRVGTGSE